MNKQVLLFALLLVLSSCWKIDLQRTEVTQGDLPIKEEILTTIVNFGSVKSPQNIPSAIDLTSDDSWVLEQVLCPNCVTSSGIKVYNAKSDIEAKISNNTGGLLYGFAGQVQFASSKGEPDNDVYSIGADTITVGGNTISDLVFYYPHGVLLNSKTSPKYNILNSVQGSLGLGQTKSTEGNTWTNLLKNEKKNSLKLEDTDNFSIHLNKKGTDKIRFGAPENFFKKGSWKKFKFLEGTAAQQVNAYSLAVDSITIGKQSIGLSEFGMQVDESEIVTDIPTLAILTTTSKFYTVSDLNMLQTIVKHINTANKNAECKETQNTYVYICNKGTKDYPEIILNLQDRDGKVQALPLKPQHYLEEFTQHGETKNVLLFRRGLYGYQNYQASQFAASHYIWLGTSFLNQYYVNIQNFERTIQIADSYQFEKQPSWFKQHWRLLALILGAILLLGLIAALILMMKKVPHHEKQQVDQGSFDRQSYRAQLANPQFLSSEQGFSKVTDSPIRKYPNDAMQGSRVYLQQQTQQVNPQQPPINRQFIPAGQNISQQNLQDVQLIPQQLQQQSKVIQIDSPNRSYNQKYMPRY